MRIKSFSKFNTPIQESNLNQDWVLGDVEDLITSAGLNEIEIVFEQPPIGLRRIGLHFVLEVNPSQERESWSLKENEVNLIKEIISYMQRMGLKHRIIYTKYLRFGDNSVEAIHVDHLDKINFKSQCQLKIFFEK